MVTHRLGGKTGDRGTFEQSIIFQSTLVCITMPRNDTDGGCEYEAIMTVTSELHARAKTKKSETR